MLKLISQYITGRISIERKNKYVVWYSTSKKDINICINILKKYPLLTSRKICKFKFMLNCLSYPTYSYFINNRNKKYEIQESIINE